MKFSTVGIQFSAFAFYDLAVHFVRSPFVVRRRPLFVRSFVRSLQVATFFSVVGCFAAEKGGAVVVSLLLLD